MFELIKEKIKEKKLSIRQLSEKTGISQRTLVRILENEEYFNVTAYKNVVSLQVALGLIKNTEKIVLADDKIFRIQQSDMPVVLNLLKKLTHQT